MLAVTALAAGQLVPRESNAEPAETLSADGIERMRALNEGGEPAREPIRWQRSRAIGRPWAGRLERGVRLPAEDATFFTWDPVLRTAPNRWWRRYGTDRLLETLLQVLGSFQDAHPDAARVGVGDLSRPRGGNFGPRFGGLGHASHQNGLDVDVYYPRRDRLEREPVSPAQIDRALAQELVDRFVAGGAQYVFVGRHTGLRGPRRMVQAIPHHDDHLHVRLRP
jgi:murein endopeptidase